MAARPFLQAGEAGRKAGEERERDDRPEAGSRQGAVADADVDVVLTPITFPKVVGKVCWGMCTRTLVNDESKEMHGVPVATIASRFTSAQLGQGNTPSG